MNRIFIVTKMMILSVLISLFVSCQMFYSKENYLNDFTEFVEAVKIDNSEYSEEDWDNAEVEYNLFAEEKYLEFEDELTTQERFKIGKLKGIYMALKFKKDAKDVGDQVKEALEQAEGILEGAKEAHEQE